MATQLQANTSGVKGISLPLWIKDYSGLLATGLFFFIATLLNSSESYYLQVLCSIGVGIIVAMGLNLIVGYIGQVALGHAGFVALGGYVLGLILGKSAGSVSPNWIDYLTVRKDATGKDLEYKELTARELALINTNNLLLTLLIIFAVVTVILGGLLYWRYRHVKQTNGAAEHHWWQNPKTMQAVSYGLFGVGGVVSVGLYILTMASTRIDPIKGKVTDIPWVLFGLAVTATLAIGYLAYVRYKAAANYTGGLRPSFWDKPAVVGKLLIAALVLGIGLCLITLALYLMGFRLLQNFWAIIILGALVAGLFGYLLALPALRVKGPYLSMVTIAFGLIIVELGSSESLKNLLGSQTGLNQIPYPVTARDPKLDVIVTQPLSREDATFQLFLTTLIIGVAVVLTLYIIRSIMRTRWGRSFIAIRENEIGAGSVGINVTRMKTLAFVLSAVLTGIAGVLNSYSFNFVGPNFAVLALSVSYVTMIILGGVGTLYGPVIGAIMITIIPQILKRLESAKPSADIFGLVGLVAPWLMVALIVLHFATRRTDNPGLSSIARYIVGAVSLIYGALTVYVLATGFDEPARFWTYVTAVMGAILVLAITAWSWGYTKGMKASTSFAVAAGLVAVFNGLELFLVILKTLGSPNGIGVKKADLDAGLVLLVVFYVITFVLSLVVTTPETRKLAVRSAAAGFIFSIPGIYRVVIGLIKGSDGSDFRPNVVEVTIYGAILLYFLYLVPKGVGGLVGEFIDRYFPTQRQIDRRYLRTDTTASADAGEPNKGAAAKHQLAFHRKREEHAEVLKLARVTRDFKGLRAVDSVDITLERGDIHALIGPNGAGKTTVLNLISGIYPVSSGEILFKGKRLDGMKPYQIADTGISRTFQNLQVFGDMTALENVMVGFHLHTKQGFWASLLGLPAVRREEERIKAYAMELLEFVGLGNRAYVRAKDLPYGYQRLLEIARALAVEPEILLLDEPAAGLNPQEIGDMDRLIRKICGEGVTVILIEHHMDLVMEISDRITVLDYGKKIAEGNPATVQSNQKVKDAYFGPEVVLDARS